jgi:hypothetical protein
MYSNAVSIFLKKGIVILLCNVLNGYDTLLNEHSMNFGTIL